MTSEQYEKWAKDNNIFVSKVIRKLTFPNFKPRINKNGNIGTESFDQADAIAVAFCHAIVNQKK